MILNEKKTMSISWMMVFCHLLPKPPVMKIKKEGPIVNVLTKDQNLLLDIIEDISKTEKRQLYLNKFKESLNQISTSLNPLTKGSKFLKTYNLIDILDKFPSKPTKPLTLQNLQTEIDLLKEDIRVIKTKQELDSLVLQNLAKEPTNSNTQHDTEFLNQLSK